MDNSPYIDTGHMRLRMPMTLDRTYQPASMKVGIWQKDMQINADMARSIDCPAPLLNASAEVYSAAMAIRLSEHDTAATGAADDQPAARAAMRACARDNAMRRRRPSFV